MLEYIHTCHTKHIEQYSLQICVEKVPAKIMARALAIVTTMAKALTIPNTNDIDNRKITIVSLATTAATTNNIWPR